MTTQNLLVELFVEELPPKALNKLGAAFSGVLAEQLKTQGLAAADAVVTMQPLKVNGGDFDYRITFDRKTNRLKDFQLTWVSPKLEKGGVRVGDRITKINGIKIEELLLDEVRKLMVPTLGVQNTFTGSGRRGLFARKAEITITITGTPPKKADTTKDEK